TISGDLFNQNNDTPFTATKVVITGTSDTSASQSRNSGGGVSYYNEHATTTIVLSGFNGGADKTLSLTKQFVTFNEGMESFLPSVSLQPVSAVGSNFQSALVIGPNESAFQTWDMMTAIGPFSLPAMDFPSLNVLNWDGSGIVTDSNEFLEFDDATVNMTFQATVTSNGTAPIPLPATALLLFGAVLSLPYIGRRRS
ncbi:MAG: hypothetical protein AAGF94_15460, partial [Pseudomonadota bacterium]